MQQPNWKIADALAVELVNRETDVNEVQKVAAHARVYAERQSEKVGERFFTLLETMVRDGRYLVRSGRTLDYYRDMREVCNQHLSGYRATSGEKGWELVETLGWAARLMRYYKTEEGERELASRLPQSGQTQQPQVKQDIGTEPLTVTVPRSAKPAQKPKAVAPPTRSEIVRETVTLIRDAKSGKALVRTTQGEEVTCSGMPSYEPPKSGESCRAAVTRENGRASKAIFKGR